MKVTLLGSTGTIGGAVLRELRHQGHDVATPGREALQTLNLSGQAAVISCIASRTGLPEEAWAIDHDANVQRPARG